MSRKKTVGDVKKFVVDRKRWYRGKGHEHSKLLNGSGKMCCLGFYAIECGLKPSNIRHEGAPSDLMSGEWNTVLVLEQRSLCSQMMGVNDDQGLDDKKREKLLTKLFKKMDTTVKFVG